MAVCNGNLSQEDDRAKRLLHSRGADQVGRVLCIKRETSAGRAVQVASRRPQPQLLLGSTSNFTSIESDHEL